MARLIDEFLLTWRGISQPSPLLAAGFAACCLALSTVARWGLSQIWASIDHRIRALSRTDDLIASVDGLGCDIKDLLVSELGPYGHVRFNLNGNPLFLPDKLAVSLALVFHELATNAGKYGAFSSPRGLLQVSWQVADDRLNITWDETEGPSIDHVGADGFGTKLLQSALRAFDGKTEINFLK